MKTLLVTLALLASPTALALAAAGTDPGNCLSGVIFGPELNSGFKVGALVVYSRYNGLVYHGSGFYLTLYKRNGQAAQVDVYLETFEVGAAAALEMWLLNIKRLQLRLPADSGSRCIDPLDVFDTFYGTGVSLGAGVFIDGELDGTTLWNKAGFSFFMGSGFGAGSIGAHASVLPLKFLMIRPLGGFKQAMRSNPGFFNAEAVYDRLSGARDLKW
jgi:hypothetical protein